MEVNGRASHEGGRSEPQLLQVKHLLNSVPDPREHGFIGLVLLQREGCLPAAAALPLVAVHVSQPLGVPNETAVDVHDGGAAGRIPHS